MVTCVGAVQRQDKLDHVVVLIYHNINTQNQTIYNGDSDNIATMVAPMDPK